MRLKHLDIHGFKSFADKTKIDFHEGVTAIVGPNGCGKSNVVDAVRWVLGETSAKALRGGQMADVIFNGTDRRKPMGLAEVSLTFSDCEQLGMEFHEVCITRRVYRDGGGEYELNGTPCRLKDINKLFMDTGVGRSAYSIMEQGKIDMLLSAKPEDRRQVFEEAAGITKSKSEKKEALRKLEYTEANLLRVTDILTELKRQMGSSQRQANKARKWQELHHDTTILDTHLHYRKYTDHGAEKAELENSIESLRARQGELEQGIADDEQQLMAERSELREMESMLNALRHDLNDRQNTIHSAESRIHLNREREHELEALIARNSMDVETNHDRLSHQETELRNADSALEAVSTNTNRLKDQIDEHARLSALARERKVEIELALRHARQAMHQAESGIIAAEAEITSYQQQAHADRARQEQLQRDTEALSAERQTRLHEEAELKQRIEDMRSEIETHELQLGAREKELQACEIGIEEATARIAEVSRQHSERSGRGLMLRDLIAQGEGLEKGTQHVLKGLDDPTHFQAGVRGLLSNYITVAPQYIPAIEAALGSNLQAVLVENALYAEDIINVLTTEKMGRALILPEDLLSKSGQYQMLTPPSGSLSWAADVVQADDKLRTMVHQLLANVLIVPDLHTALSLKKENPEIAFATLSGEFVSMEGAVSGGIAAERSGSMLQRQAELKELDAEAATLEATLHELEATRLGRQTELRTLKLALDEQREILRIRSVQESELQGKLSLTERELQGIKSRQDSIQWDLTQLDKRQETTHAKVEECTGRRARSHEDLEGRRAEISQGEGDLENAIRHEGEAFELLNELRTSLAVEQRAGQALNEQRAPMNGRLRELEEAISRSRHEIESYQERIDNAHGENQRLEDEMASARQQVEEYVLQIESQNDDRTRRAETLEERERLLTTARREISAFHEQRGREEVKVTQISLRMESLHTYATERYRVDLLTFEQDIHSLLTTVAAQKAPATRSRRSSRPDTVESPDESTPPHSESTSQEPTEDPAASLAEEELEVIVLSEDEAAPAPLEIDEVTAAAMLAELEATVDWEYIANSVGELKSRLDSMGPVNLDSIQEFEELEERHNFLQSEFDDLNNAKVELLNVIARINEETKKRFVETFTQVRDNFRNTFKELFGAGAQADLVLVNEADPLESGIDVIAKPPGKKPTSITLLSGGERSMTAVALLFSIYMVKPSPFCILDELDAPLDESNIGRFLKMLDKFIEKSQFVIVTHNKRTMRRADIMYGVTMEEFGVSKPVGMKLTETEGNKRRSSAIDGEAPIQAMPADAPTPQPALLADATTSEEVPAEEEAILTT